MRELKNLLTISEWAKEDIPPLTFMKVGVRQFDDLCGGLARGSITVVSGYSGNGKSFVLMSIARHLAKNYRVLYISVENLIQVDMDRLKKLKIDCPDENFVYTSVQFNRTLDYNSLAEDICEAVEILNYDAVFIDGGDILIEGTDGASMYENGNAFMKRLMAACSKNNVPVVMSWQLTREAERKRIEDIGTSDIATSMGVVRYASCVLAVKRVQKEEEKTWQLRMTKARFEYKTSPIDVLGYDGNFSLAGPDAIFHVKQEKIS